MDKDVYIKTEPGGIVSFGKLTPYDINLFKLSKNKKTISNDLLYKIKKGITPYTLVKGVSNTGEDGDFGNEGQIEIQDIFSIPRDKSNKYKPGFYAIYLSLSKVSVQFKISDIDHDVFNPNLLIEKSIKINLPNCVEHQIYDLNFNIVNSYEYKGKNIKNANKNMVDRGFSDLISIFQVDSQKVSLLYNLENSNEVFFG
jgi:hypothetical protein